MKHCKLLLALLIMVPVVAKADDDILTTAAANGSFKTLVNLVVAAGLDEALQSDGEFTVFAPTDEAFAKLPHGTLESLLKPENREQLADILKYHVLPSEVSIARRRPSHPITSAKTLLGKKINFERQGTEVRINDAKVLIRNISCSNGLIQVVDSVLLPPVPDNSIIGVAKIAGKFSTLIAAVDAAGLTETLSSDGPLTVFAPTDKAFKALPKGTLEELLKPENKEKLATILKYHVVSGRVTAADAIQTGKANTLANQGITFSIRDGRISVNKANVISNDIAADNGIIHVIDQVLLPGKQPNASDSTSDHASELIITSDWDSPVERDGVTADRIVIRCGGAGRVRLTNVNAHEIETRIGGGGSVEIEGTVVNHKANVSGGATLSAKHLATQITEIRVNGGGNAVVNATEKLIASANSGATLNYVETLAQIEKRINKYADFSPVSTDSASSTHH